MKLSARYSRIARFLVAGGLAALTEYGVFVGMLYIFAGIFLAIPQSISFMAGFVVSFMLNRKWVFKSIGSSRTQILKYTALALTNLALSNVAIWLFVDVALVNAIFAKIAVMAVIAIWNYVLFSRIIFVNK